MENNAAVTLLYAQSTAIMTADMLQIEFDAALNEKTISILGWPE